MRQVVRLGLRLAWAGAREQRGRTAALVGSVLVGSVVLLGTAAVAASEAAQRPEVFVSADNRRLLLAVVAAVALPVLVLVATVGRLSASLRDRRMGNLRLLGLGRTRVRLVVAVETGSGALAGSVLGVGAFWAVRPLLGGVHVAGRGWPTPTLAPAAWAYALVVLGLPLVVTAAAALPQRLDMGSAMSRARRADRHRPGWWRLVPVLAGGLLCLLVIAGGSRDQVSGGVLAAFFAGVVLLGVGVIVLVPVFVRLVADAMLHVGSRPTLTVAARRLQAQPAAVSRVVSGLLVGLFLVIGARSVVVAFESTPQYVAAVDALHQRQVVATVASHAQAASLARRSRAVDGVRRVVSLPELTTRCSANDPCVEAVVGTCAQLRAAGVDTDGCREGEPFALPHQLAGGGSVTWHLHAVHAYRPVRDVAPVSVTVPGPVSGEVADDDTSPGAPLQTLSAELLVPPATPGLAPLLARTDVDVVTVGPPGRDLADRLPAATGEISAPDFTDYDFVAQLRTLVWAIAVVIVSVGLLAFAVAAVDRAVTRRREVTSLQLVGVSRSLLRRTQWVEAAVPLALGCTLAVGLGLLAGATYLSLVGQHLPVPAGPALLLAAVAVAGSVVVGAVTVIASCPPISPDLIRQE